jgi:ribosomal protein S18 acetylase RimI-like enzyme
MRIRHVLAHEADRLKAIRLRSLEADPAGFSSTHASEVAFADEVWATRAATSEAGDEGRTYVVVVDGDDRWLGLAVARRDERGVAVLNAMWVAPEARGQGAAKALCDACAGWAKQHGFDWIDVEVFADNLAGRRLYEAAGFVAVGGERLVVMRRGV